VCVCVCVCVCIYIYTGLFVVILFGLIFEKNV